MDEYEIHIVYGPYHVYPYYTRDGVHIANKLRRRSVKGFLWEGESSQAALFGQQLFPAGSAWAVRCDPATQKEHREVAEKTRELILAQYPMIKEALDG